MTKKEKNYLNLVVFIMYTAIFFFITKRDGYSNLFLFICLFSTVFYIVINEIGFRVNIKEKKN